MNFSKNTKFLVGFSALAVVACEQPSQVRSSPADTAEQGSSAEVQVQEVVSNGKVSLLYNTDPIPSTTPPDSEMNPSSNAYIIFDGSGSMSGEPINQARKAVKAFVADSAPELNIGLFVFDGLHQQGAEVVSLGRGAEQRQQLATAVGKIQAGGGTPLGGAILSGTESLISQFQRQLRYGDIRLIVVTDGQASDARQFEESIDFASKNHVPIYTIGFHIQQDHPLRNFSEAYFTANDEEELLGAMKETLAELDDSSDPNF